MEVAGRPIPPDLAALLERFHFERVPFERAASAHDRRRRRPRVDAPHQRADRGAGGATWRSRLPAPGTPEGRRAAALGREIIGRGEVAAVVLAGGMATRFGSRVKALAPVLSGHDLTFLDLKLADLTRFGVEVVLMTSFATHDALAEAVEGTGVRLAPQLVSLRLNPDGSLFLA